MDKSTRSEYYHKGEANEGNFAVIQDMNIMIEKNNTDITQRKMSRLSKRIKESFNKIQEEVDISNLVN